MTVPDRVTPEEAAVVFRRAAELDSVAAAGRREAVLDLSALEEIGREVGLDPSSVRAALAELRAGSLEKATGGIAWGAVVSSRVLLRPASEISMAINELARRNLLTLQRRRGNETLWTRAGGMRTAVARRLGGRRRHPLSGLRELRCSVVDQPPGSSRLLVRLEGRLIFPWRLLPVRSQVVAAAGVGGGVLALITGLDNVGDNEFATAAGALVAAGASGIALRAHRDAVVTTEYALDRFLDRLEQGATAASLAVPT